MVKCYRYNQAAFSPLSRFCDHWRFVSQRFAFLGAFIVYLESEKLITRPELAEMLGGLFELLRNISMTLQVF